MNEVQKNETYYRNLRVSVWQGKAFYSGSPPYHPSEKFPEYPFNRIGNETNPAYEGVRNCLRMLGLDLIRYGTPDWNPLQSIVNPGDSVVIKPNFVVSRHGGGGDLYSIITHPSVIRAIIDYTYMALGGQGRIIVANAPQMDCNFQELLQETKLLSIQEFYWGQKKFKIEILDLRDFWLDSKPGDNSASISRRKPLSGDPKGSVLVELGKQSAFYGKNNWDKFYGADYNREETISHHHGAVQQYMLSKTVLSSNVLISVPKLKVHKKVGVTLNAKGLIGVTTNKNYLIHYTLGTPDNGGDQFPTNLLSPREKILIKGQRFLYDLLLARRKKLADDLYDLAVRTYRFIFKPFLGKVAYNKQILDAGNWHGNDSTWRMVVDLMRIIYFSDSNGNITNFPQRRVFSIIDGIIGGENDGPLTPDAKKAGCLIAGFNPLAVDIVGARLMGFDWKKIKWIVKLLESPFYASPEEISIMTDGLSLASLLESDNRFLDFVPHPGWQGYLEV